MISEILTATPQTALNPPASPSVYLNYYFHINNSDLAKLKTKKLSTVFRLRRLR